jgi:tellurite methyltransferase
MAFDDRERWEARYDGDISEPKGTPSEFLVAHAHLLRGRVLDVAAGAGRNALFLARRGLSVDAVDIAFAGLHRLRRAAVAEGLCVRAVQADLDTFPLPDAQFDAIINIRYLQRALFAPMQRAVKPGGLILFETFLIDQQTIGHPQHPEFLLQRGELRVAFRACELLEYDEGLFRSSGAPAFLARMLARRPAGLQD